MSTQVLVKRKNKVKKKAPLKENQYISAHVRDEETEVIASELRDIQNKEGLNAQNVLDRAKDKSSVLHRYFTWDDNKAAENWRKWQARFLINSVRVVISGTPIQAFESVKINVETKERRYVDIITIRSNKNYESQLFNKALKEIKYWQDKYKRLQKLSPVFDAIESVEKEVSDE